MKAISIFSSDLGVLIYSIQYLLTILGHILFTSLPREAKNEDSRDSSLAKLLKSPPLTTPFIFVMSFWIELIPKGLFLRYDQKYKNCNTCNMYIDAL